MKDCWPFGVALRGAASNHLMLRWLKTVVVSDEEKAHKMRQVGIGKASASESLLKCRNLFRSVGHRHAPADRTGCHPDPTPPGTRTYVLDSCLSQVEARRTRKTLDS